MDAVSAGSDLSLSPLEDARRFRAEYLLKGNLIQRLSLIHISYRFTEGSMQVSLELIHIIRANGGTVLNRKEVTRILVKDEACLLYTSPT